MTDAPDPAVQIAYDVVGGDRGDIGEVVATLRKAGYVHNPAEVAALRKVAALARGLAEEVGDSDLLDALEALDAVTGKVRA